MPRSHCVKTLANKVKLGGKKYCVELWDKLMGEHGHIDRLQRTIRLDRRQNEKDLFDTIIHEGFHGLFPWMEEYKVNNSATEFRKYLWKLGYRRIELDGPIYVNPDEKPDDDGNNILYVGVHNE